jgi:hypothetical protein
VVRVKMDPRDIGCVDERLNHMRIMCSVIFRC